MNYVCLQIKLISFASARSHMKTKQNIKKPALSETDREQTQLTSTNNSSHPTLLAKGTASAALSSGKFWLLLFQPHPSELISALMQQQWGKTRSLKLTSEKDCWPQDDDTARKKKKSLSPKRESDSCFTRQRKKKAEKNMGKINTKNEGRKGTTGKRR